MSTDVAAQTQSAVSTLIHALPPRPQAFWVDFLEALPARVATAARQDPMRAEAIANVIERAAWDERMPSQDQPASTYRLDFYEHLAGLQRDLDEVSE